MKKTLVMLALAMLSSVVALAQTTDVKAPKNSILSGQQEIMNEKTPSPLPEIDESNVMWKKTVIREIDFRQKINQVFYYPINPTEDWRNLITVIYDGIQSGEITAYRVENNIDDMVTPLTLADFEKENTKIGDPPVIWKDGEEVPNEIAFKDRMLNVTRLRIKEDWYFDKKLSQFLVRIIALGPIVVEEDGLSQVCWIPYEDSRPVLANAFAFNRNNAAQRLTITALKNADLAAQVAKAVPNITAIAVQTRGDVAYALVEVSKAVDAAAITGIDGLVGVRVL